MMSSQLNKNVALLKSTIACLGGVEKITLRLAKAFQDNGCNVTLVTSGPTTQTNAVTYEPAFGMSALKVTEFDRFCKRYVTKHCPEIVFGMDRNSIQTHLRAGNGVHAAYLKHRGREEGLLKAASFKINPLHLLLLKLEKEAFEHPELQTLFTNSHLVRDEILEYYDTDPKKIEVIHNGVEWEEMESDFNTWQEGKQALCRELSLDPAVFHFVFIGHNFRRKGLDKLLCGLSLLSKESFHLSVVGKDKNAHHFITLSENLGLSKKVSFFGEQRNTRRFYQLADVLVIPSLYDPFANVTVEALAMGVFVVSSMTNGGHEVLTEDSGIKIAALDNPEAIAEALKEALACPKTMPRAAAIRASVQHLDFSTQLNKLVSLTLA